MAEVASLLLSPFLQVLFERLASRDFLDFFRNRKLDAGLLKRLEILLLSANAVIEEAEDMQFTKPMVKKWLHELKDAVYDAEDILDEIHSEVLRCNLDAEYQTISTKVRKTISASFNPFVREIEPKIKDVLETLDHLVKQKDAIGLKEGVGGKSSGRSSTTSLVQESDIFGRNDDKEAIINLLLSDNVSGNELCVIAIAGMGGLGKTTLAQLVYNDDRMKAHFDLKLWVYVSDDFDVLKMTKTMLEELGLSTNIDGKSLNWLQVTLQQNLTGKKFLIILDDVWNKKDSEWEALSKPFKSGAKGSRVIVTTREKRVASIMQSTTIFDLKKLEEEYCWSLFSKHAFHSGNSNGHPDQLEVIGRQIVKRCNGLPLAIKTIGALLRSELDVGEWNKILRSEIWDLSSEVIPALRLSYKYLPLHLKRCFAYCSIFPQDYYFRKGDLILLWMAEGFLPEVNDKTMEQIGDDYFVDLVSRSLFQQSSHNSLKYGMHDLVNDLARFVSDQFIIRLVEGENSPEIVNKTRHLSFVTVDTTKKFGALGKAKGLRTILPIYSYINEIFVKGRLVHDLLLMLQFLRVLNLSHSYNLTELPDSIGKMKHLRHLDVSRTSIRKLPDSICKLCNLQTLRISDCFHLTVLPRDIHKLINLHHLDFSDSPSIKEMPVQLGNLSHLQTLTKFIVSKQSRGGVEELGKLANLRGKLHISNLQNVASPIHALAASLNDKRYLEELTLEWNVVNDNISESQTTVLENLRPNENLKSLSIIRYRGKSFPNWIGHHSFGALKVLKFRYMPKLEKLFAFDAEIEGGAFTHLEELEIVNCYNLTGDLPIHPSLSRLVIVKCPLLVTSLPSAATLRQLEIGGFGALESVPERLMDFNSCLEELKISGCYSLTSLSSGDALPSTLKVLEIEGCRKLELPIHWNYSSIETLRLQDSCDSLKSFPLNLFPNLKSIKLNGCRNLESVSVPQQHELDLMFITITGCPNFASFPNGGLHAPNLLYFGVKNCPSLTSLPDDMHTLLPSLSELELETCPEVDSFPEGGLPSKLASIEITDSDKLFANRRGWRLQNLPSLQFFTIKDNCKDVDSFPEAGLLPNSLLHLTIFKFPNMKSLDCTALRHLTSLEVLSINYCPKLRFMQIEELPASISTLEIYGCALLKKQLQSRKGKAWRKIAHIHCIKINGELT